MRATGAALILLSAVAYLFAESRMHRSQEKLVQDILDAIEQMETLIRWENRTLPDSIEAQAERGSAGRYFSKIAEYLKSGIPLQTAWTNVFSSIQPGEVSAILCDVLLSGDSTFLRNRLSKTAEQIREFQHKTRANKHEKQKLRVALSLSAAVLVVILLL